jgi:CDP-diacylglycerol--serine O-phosphatidyltransferase
MSSGSPKIYLWPNLMTAGNLLCGFFAIMYIVTYRSKVPGQDFDPAHAHHYYNAIMLILGACLFDALDGRIARMVGEESPFGREFDSLADIISFGMAPALLVHEIVLKEFNEDWDRLGWIIAVFYLLCGAMRLARFNCTAAAGSCGDSRDFQGCPIPAAAGVISSITLLLLNLYSKDKEIGNWKYVLVIIMVLLSLLMFSNVKYPSFKGLSWRTRRSFPWVLGAICMVLLIVWKWHIMLPTLFLSYLFYGLVRPWVSKRWRQEIEDDPDDLPESSAATIAEKDSEA